MKVRVGVGRKVVVDGKVDLLNVDATAEDVGGDADTLVEILELFVALDAEFGLAEWRKGWRRKTYRSSCEMPE